VCVLGSAVRRELFPLGGALGSEVKIGGQWLTVVGVMARRDGGIEGSADGGTGSPNAGAGRSAGGASIGAGDPNVEVYVPLSTVLRRFVHDAGGSELSSLIVRITDPDRSVEAADLLARVLQRRHAGAEDYRLVVPEALLRQRQATQRIFNIVMGAIAGISLLVGGIGIMNIMLASVLERTREIGIRRAVGATRRDVMGQFLTEAVVVSVLGGVIGIGVGFALTQIIATAAGWRTAVPIPAVVLAFGVSAAVGIVFGWMPARRAAQLTPIESLRYE
jgi:putative ABC transport system permease protein